MSRTAILILIMYHTITLSIANNIEYDKIVSEIESDYKRRQYQNGISKCDILIDNAQKQLEYNNDYIIYGYYARGILKYYQSDTSSGKEDIKEYTRLLTSKNVDTAIIISQSKPILHILTKKRPDTLLLIFYYEQLIKNLGQRYKSNRDMYHNTINEYILINKNFINKYDFISNQFEMLEKEESTELRILEHYIVLHDALSSSDDFSDSIINTWPPSKLMESYLDFYSKGVEICEKYNTNDTLTVLFNNLYGFILAGNSQTEIAIKHLEKSIKTSYVIKFYPESFIESIKYLSTLYNLTGKYIATIELLEKFDKLNLIIPKEHSNIICTNRINAIYALSKGIQNFKDLADSVGRNFNCDYQSKDGISNQKEKTKEITNIPLDTNSININNISENIELCQKLHSEGFREIADIGFQKIGSILKNYNQLEIPILKLLKLKYNIIYIQYINEFSKNSSDKKNTCINEITKILQDKSYKPPKEIEINGYITLMDFHKTQNRFDTAVILGKTIDSMFTHATDNLILIFYPSFLYSYFDLLKNNEQNISLLDKAIRIEKETNIDIVSYQSYIKIFNKLYTLKDKSIFEEYINKFTSYLETFININYLFYNKEQQQIKLANYLIDIDMLIYYAKELDCSVSCLNTLYGSLFSLRNLEVDTYKYLKEASPYQMEQVKRFISYRDSVYKLSTEKNVTSNKDNSVEIFKELNLFARKLMLDSKIKLVQFTKYSPDSIRQKLESNECFIFNYSDYYLEDSSRQLVLKYDSLKFGIGFDKSADRKSLIVRSVLKHSPSIKYLNPNDIIIQVNNVKYESDNLAREIFNSNKIYLKYIRGTDTLSNTINRDSVYYEYYSAFENWIIINRTQTKPEHIRTYIGDYINIQKDYTTSIKEENKFYLFNSYFDTILNCIFINKNIYYSLSEKYNTINIEWLQKAEDNSFLSKDHNFYNCTNTSDFYSLKTKSIFSTNKDVVIFANPSLSTYNTTTSINTYDRSNSEDLNYYHKTNGKLIFYNIPFTETEASYIKKIGEKMDYHVTYYSENECNEYNLKRLNSPSILHIATHGYISQKNDKHIFKNEFASNNDLLNTSLILSEYNKNKKEDGILTALEIIGIDLTKTELVVLSACETAIGEQSINGNSSNSLQRAFRLAGAKAVLASKWKVPDEPTQELMTEFYTNWLEKGMTKHKALQQAQLTLSKKYPNPYNWAAWVLYGE